MSFEDRIRRLEQAINALKDGGVGWSRFPAFSKYPRWIYPNNAEWVGTAYMPLTSTSWDGDSFSTTAKTEIDLYTVFGVPVGAKAVLLYVDCRDSASSTSDAYIMLDPTNTAGQGLVAKPSAIDDRRQPYQLIIPCNSLGNVYYQIVASGVDTLDVWMRVWGYAI